MSLLTALARMHAVQTGQAQMLGRMRHFTIADEPMAVVVLNHSGEVASPLAAMVGTARRRPVLLHVTRPRDREQRMGFLAELAGELLGYVERCRHDTEALPAAEGEAAVPCHTRAPQVLVANPATRRYLGLLGRATRFLPTEGPGAVKEAVRAQGRWLTFLTERAELPGSSVLPAITGLLARHWATGQSALEDANLAAFLAWIDPPPGMSAAEAARAAEDPLRYPPAGPATDPGFDNHVLHRCLVAIDTARRHGDGASEERAVAALRRELESQMRPTWELLWRGVRLLRGLPEEAPSAAQRWREDRIAFTEFAQAMDAGRAPQPRRDSAVAAARRLDRMERAQARFEARRALEDPFWMAERRLSGEAFGGQVVDREPQRTTPGQKGGPRLRPLLVLRTPDPVKLPLGRSLRCAEREKLSATILDIEEQGDARLVTVELTGGMGRGKTPKAGTVPEVGEELCFTEGEDFVPLREFPEPQDTPWTHGGAPADAGEGVGHG